MENKFKELQKEVSETKEVRSLLEHEKAEWEQELSNLRCAVLVYFIYQCLTSCDIHSMWVCAYWAHALACVLKLGADLGKSVSFRHVGPQDPAQVVGLRAGSVTHWAIYPAMIA